MKASKNIVIVFVLNLLAFNCFAQDQKKIFEAPIQWIGLSSKGAVTSGPQREHVDALRAILKERALIGARGSFKFPALAKVDGVDQPMEIECYAEALVFPNKKLFYENLDREAANPTSSQSTNKRLRLYIDAQRSGVLIRYEGGCRGSDFFDKLSDLGFKTRSILEVDGLMFEMVPIGTFDRRIHFVF
jgi:hypothetical protein